MRMFWSTLLVFSVGIWLGAYVGLIVFVGAIFKEFSPDRQLAGRATSSMFVVFSQMQLYLAAVAVVSAFAFYMARRNVLNVMIFVLLAIATVGSAINKLKIIPEMETIRQAGNSASPQFKQLHAYSMIIAVATVICLAITLLIAPVLIKRIYAAPASTRTMAS